MRSLLTGTRRRCESRTSLRRASTAALTTPSNAELGPAPPSSLDLTTLASMTRQRRSAFLFLALSDLSRGGGEPESGLARRSNPGGSGGSGAGPLPGE